MARLLIVEDNAELAALMVATAKARGHEAVPAYSGEHARALMDSVPFDAAVVDLLLPDLRGGELLALLKSKGVPGIAVSGVFKGDRYAKEAVEQHGAKAFFEKPFQMNDVLRAAETAAGIIPADVDEPFSAELQADDLEELEELAPIEEEEQQPPKPSPTEAKPDVVLPFADRDKVWAKPAAAVAEPAKKKEIPRWAESGTLSQSPVAKLLGAYYQARHSGELKLRQGNVNKVVYFENGRPAYAASNLASERFARFCVRRGVISESDLTAVAAIATEQKLRTGQAMLRLGLIDGATRKHLLAEQVKEIIWSTFGWTQGDYSFTLQRPNRPDVVKLDIFPGDLVLEGVERSVPLVQLRQRMPGNRKMFPTADPPYHLHELKLSGGQARLLAYCDGTKTVEDLLTVTDLSEREALATLVAFELMSLIEPREDQKKRERVSFGL